MRTNTRDIDRIFGLFASFQELDSAAKEMEKRFRLIPNGWRDLRLIISKLDKLLVGIMSTIPPEKQASVKRMAPRMRFKVNCGIQASTLEKNECVVLISEVEALCRAAHEKCWFCQQEDKCNRCYLGKVLDSVLTYDREGSSWASVNFNELE